MQNTPRRPSPPTEDLTGELASSVSASLRTPIAALRASLETLARDLGGDDARARSLGYALEEVVRIGRQVQTLVDFALPAPLHALRCRADELARAAISFLTPAARPRVVLACENACASIEVDGTHFSRALALLLEDALEGADQPVLLVARCEEREASFTILHDKGTAANAERSAGSALGVMLARRDLERLGARANIDPNPSGPACTLVRCPLVRTSGGRP
jgi:signal transduction histidine kinase